MLYNMFFSDLCNISCSLSQTGQLSLVLMFLGLLQMPPLQLPPSAPSIPDDERDIDWEDYNYLPENDKGGEGGRLSDEAFASMMDMIPEFYGEKLDAVLCCLPMPDEAEVP
jgi:hypothetical protein